MCFTVNFFLTVLLFVLCCMGFCSSVGERKHYGTHDCPLGSLKHTLIGCNFCKCYQGNLVNCSHYSCSEDGFIIDGNELTCIEREMKYDKCTICQCRNNTWHCLEPRCNTTLTRSKRSPAGIFCTRSGKKLKTACNECVCQDQQWRCTERDCQRHASDKAVKYYTFREQDLDNIKCAPGYKISIDCLFCKCKNRGLGFECQRSADCDEDVPSNIRVHSVKYFFDNTVIRNGDNNIDGPDYDYHYN